MFCLTYGDGLSDLNISNAIKFHKNHGKQATLTSVFAPGRFGMLDIDTDGKVNKFIEKPKGDGSKINGGFFVLSPKIMDLIDSNDCVWEREPLEKVCKQKQLSAFKHTGFWHCIDTKRDIENLKLELKK